MKDTTPSTRNALRTLLIILAIAVGIVIYALGWNTTEISLEEVQDETRQASVKRALRELLSPDIFTRDRIEKTYTATFTIGCPDQLPETRVQTDGDAYLEFDPPCAEADDVIAVTGYDFPAGAIARIQLVPPTGQNLPFKLAVSLDPNAKITEESLFDIDGAGYFEVGLKVPRGRGLDGKTHNIIVQTLVPTGNPRFSNTTEIVIEKMIETIFLALMATTLALPIAIVLSFIAARNLMRQVNLYLGVVLVGFILLPVGAVLGSVILAPIGTWAVDLGEDLIPGLVVISAALALFAAVSYILNVANVPSRLASILQNLLLVISLVVVLGALGGIGLWISSKLQDGLLGHLGNFVGTLGELVDLTITAIAALAIGLWLSSLGAASAANVLRHVQSPLSNILGAVLGALAGGMLLAATGYIGMQAVLLGLLTPIVASVLGGQIAIAVLEALGLLPTHEIKADQSFSERVMRMVIFVVGVVVVFIGTATAMDLIRAVVDQRLPSRIARDLFGLFELEEYVIRSTLIGVILGGAGGGLAGSNTSFPLGMTVYNTARTILNMLRAIEPLIMGIVFVIWVGIGPFAGVLALTLHSIAALGKLYSEQVENIDAGPIEAIQSTGANRLQTIIYAVVPQIVPPYIAFTMYRWDINVRMSTIIGFVGGGGIGFLLQQQINLLRYKQAGVAVLAIAIVVSALDYASAAIRERIV